jgi:hypothetical protein
MGSIIYSTASYGRELTVADPTGTPLNIRNIRGEVVCTVQNGAKVVEIEKDGGFYHMSSEWTAVRTRSGCTGKAWSKYLRPAAPKTLTVADPTGTPLNIRDPDGSIKCTARNGEKVSILNKSGKYKSIGSEWTVVRTSTGCTGRAWSKYLR